MEWVGEWNEKLTGSAGQSLKKPWIYIHVELVSERTKSTSDPLLSEECLFLQNTNVTTAWKLSPESRKGKCLQYNRCATFFASTVLLSSRKQDNYKCSHPIQAEKASFNFCDFFFFRASVLLTQRFMLFNQTLQYSFIVSLSQKPKAFIPAICVV